VLFRNTLAQSAPLVASYVLSFILAPLMLSRLGLAAFGVWAVTGALGLYAGLLDLGISRALARFVAYYDARGDRRGVREAAALGLLAIGVVAVLAVGVSLLVAPLLSSQLGVLDTSEMRLVLLCTTTMFVSNALSAVLSSVPVGLQRMVGTNVAEIVTYGVNFAFSVTALMLSTKLTDYALANAAAGIVGLLLQLGVFMRVWAAPRLAWPSTARVREILGFSVKSQVNWLADLVNFHTDKLIIAMLVGPRAAGTYEIASRVVVAVRSVALMATSAMVPAATAAIVEHGRGVIGSFYARYTRLSLGVALPVFGVTAVGAPFILTVWLDETPPDSVAVLLVLSAAYFVNLMTNVASIVVIGEGSPGLLAWTSALMAVLNVAFTAALAPFFGLWGVLVGTFAAVTAGSLIFLARFHDRYEVPIRTLVASAGPPAALTLALVAPFAAWYAIGVPDADTRPEAAVFLIGVCSVFVLVYWVVASRMQMLPRALTLRWPRRAVPSS
jgi:O-antigen/teichoic acid export membrane protein